MRPIEPKLQRFFFPDDLTRSIQRAQATGCCVGFAETVLRDLNIKYEVQKEDLERVPAVGPAIVTANHPFGFLEGFILLSLLERVRPDFKIVANSLLASVALLRDRVIFVNPYPEQSPTTENSRALRECLEWLRSGGLLVTFPAGEVSHWSWGGEQPVVDTKWNEIAARLARRAGCATLPLFFDGANSLQFQMIGSIHPRLRTLNLARGLMNKRSRTIRLHIGTPITATVLRGFPNAASATAYLRARVYLLSKRLNPNSPVKHIAAIVRTRSDDGIIQEIAALPTDRLLASSSDFDVYVASSSEIPNTLREIGCAREITFRQVGEGTNKSIDLDRFDAYYQHLFLWSKRDRQIAGAYRLVATPDVIPKYGAAGLYTSTLFQYGPGFFDRMGPAFELGRSFIRVEYQKQYNALLLLWRGITRCIERRPECAVVFGAVSISGDYHPLSRVLLTNFLDSRLVSDLATLVKPRRPYQAPVLSSKHVMRLSSMVSTVEELSSSISDLEGDGKGVPVLIRQYLRMGGQFLGFSIDPSFSNALDGLIVADLRTIPSAMLDRCMGRVGAASFRAWHNMGV